MVGLNGRGDVFKLGASGLSKTPLKKPYLFVEKFRENVVFFFL